MFCPKCGCRNDDSSKFCLGCGASLVMFVQSAPPKYAPNEQPIYTSTVQPITLSVQPIAPAPYTATPKAIGTAIVAIVALIMLCLPWIEPYWGLTLNYFDFCLGDKDGSVIALIGLIAYGTLAIVSVITGFRGTKTGFGIAAGTLGIFMGAIMFMVEGTVGYGVYLFLAANFLLIIMSTLEK